MVLVTDGQIAGEDSVLRLLGTLADEQRPRLFCLGIDRAVNASVLQRMADYTGGTFELVESENRLSEVLKGFADEIGSPALTELSIHSENHSATDLTVAPSRHTVLYSGRCRSIYGRAPSDRPLRLTVQGRLANGATWIKELVAQPKPSTEMLVLLPVWRRTRLRDLEDRWVTDAVANPQLRDEIIRCSLSCNVMCRFTAFVAVDATERVTSQVDPHRIVQPTESPEGWRHPMLPAIRRADLVSRPGKVSLVRTNGAALPPQFADLVLQNRVASAEQLAEAERYAQQTGQNLGDALTSLKYASDEDVSRVIAQCYRLPYVDPRNVEIAEEILELVPESVARENDILPYHDDGNALTVLISNPADFETIEKLRFILNRIIHTMVAPRDAIHEAINRFYGQTTGESADSMLQEFTDTAIDFTDTDVDYGETLDTYLLAENLNFAPSESGGSTLSVNALCIEPPEPSAIAFRVPPEKQRKRSVRSDTPSQSRVVQLVNLLIAEALQLRASHIIVRSTEEAVRFTLVIDGVEVERDHLPRHMHAAVVTRLKILANVDVSVSDHPQSGRISLTIGDREISAFAHFAPFADGTSILIDLDSQSAEPMTPPLSEPPEAVRIWWEQRNACTGPLAS